MHNHYIPDFSSREFRVASLICKFIAGQIEPHEIEELSEWINNDHGNAALFSELTNATTIREATKHRLN